MDSAEKMKTIVEALGRGDMVTIASYWDEEGEYDNPIVGPPVAGKRAVMETIEILADGFRKNNESIVVDRSTGSGNHAVVEWHIEPGDGSRRGVHVGDFGENGLLKKVSVYPRV